ncbi:MAG: electron transfer flavoprotein subunit alpha/FixB family protein [Actinomycetia bacterium]|nr:electron transfer flavoprotein subunit alpha/FixB family protein [Actinomycetes bacterium]
MTLGKIWVFAEATADGQPSGLTLEMISKARDLGTVEAVVGGDAASMVAGLGAHGVSSVLATGDLGGALPGVPVASALAAAVEAGNGPDLLMVGTSYDGRDVAGRLSAKVGAPVITNVVDIEVDGSDVIGLEPVFGGTTNVKTKFTGDSVKIMLVRPKSFEASENGGSPAAVNALAVPEAGTTGGAVITNRHVEESEGPQLDDASVVVAGGRGMGEADSYQLIEDLAKQLGAAPGASRAIVDAGWVPYSYQVGQTGKVVKPDVYIAAGISGATQHMVGMKGSKTIIAINKDSEAPIFGIADLGIVGDVHKVLPALLAALEAR